MDLTDITLNQTLFINKKKAEVRGFLVGNEGQTISIKKCAANALGLDYSLIP